jgi:hypothetical protein
MGTDLDFRVYSSFPGNENLVPIARWTQVSHFYRKYINMKIYQENSILQEDFCFLYLDLSVLAGIQNINDRWKRIYFLFKNEFKDSWKDLDPSEPYYHTKVRDSLRYLREYGVRRWIIALDEYHFLFNQLSDSSIETIAEEMKLIILDNDSPRYFALAGSTQATFWWSLHKARPNGLNMMTGATILTTKFVSPLQEIDLCKQVLIQKHNANAVQLDEIVDLLALTNVVNLNQVYQRIFTGVQKSPKDAYNAFVDSKIEVFRCKCFKFLGIRYIGVIILLFLKESLLIYL